MSNKDKEKTPEYRLMELQAKLEAHEKDADNLGFYREWPARIVAAESYQTNLMLTNHAMKIGDSVLVFEMPKDFKHYRKSEAFAEDITHWASDITKALSTVPYDILRDCRFVGVGVVLEGYSSNAIVTWTNNP